LDCLRMDCADNGRSALFPHKYLSADLFSEHSAAWKWRILVKIRAIFIFQLKSDDHYTIMKTCEIEVVYCVTMLSLVLWMDNCKSGNNWLSIARSPFFSPLSLLRSQVSRICSDLYSFSVIVMDIEKVVGLEIRRMAISAYEGRVGTY
jgi:hypothetical protein